MLRCTVSFAMDILTLQLSLEELHVNQSGKNQQSSKFMMKDFTAPPMQGLHNNENLNQLLTARRGEADSYGFNLCSSPAYDVISTDRSAFTIPPSSVCRTLTKDNVHGKADARGHINGNLCTMERDREGSRNCELYSETSVLQYASLSSVTPVLMEHNCSEEELSRIDWSSQQVTPHASNSSGEELCKEEDQFIDRPRPSSSDCFCPAALTPGVKPVELPVSWISDTSLKRKAFLISSNCDSSAVILRPNLDFDKMRKTSYLQRHSNNDIKRPRLVRIRGFKDPLNCVRSLQRKFCPSVAAFNSLSLKSGIK